MRRWDRRSALSSPDDEHNLVPEFLELPQFAQPHHMSHVDIRGTGVEAFFKPEFFARC